MSRRLSLVDSAFLVAENRRQPLHVGALCLLRKPRGAPPDFAAQLARRMRDARDVAVPFNRRLEGRAPLARWVEVGEFDLAQHFVHLALPKPGGMRELLGMVSRVHSAHLDRAYPLWRTYLIEGLGDGRIATYSKIHHSVVDGVAGLRLMMKSMTDSAASSQRMPALWEMQRKRSSFVAVPGAPALGMSTLGEALRRTVRGSPAVLRNLRETYADYLHDHPDLVTSWQSPESILNGPISGSRRFAAESFATPRFKAIATCFGATTNDVVLAVCGGALRRYLRSVNALPEKPLVAAVPVSLRRDDSADGNSIAFALANLGTQFSDPLQRIEAVKRSMDYAKARFRTMTGPQLLAYSVATLVPGAATLIPGIGGRAQRVANVVISHVPGPRKPVFWQGCGLEGMYPASLIIDGIALNITLISRHDFIDFGVLACRRTLPGIQRLLADIEAEICAIESALGLRNEVPLARIA